MRKGTAPSRSTAQNPETSTGGEMRLRELTSPQGRSSQRGNERGVQREKTLHWL